MILDHEYCLLSCSSYVHVARPPKGHVGVAFCVVLSKEIHPKPNVD